MNDSQKQEVLQLFPFISGLSPAEQEEVFGGALFRQEPAGVLLIEEGESCQGMVLVLEGGIRIYKLSPEGRELTLYRLAEGEICVLSAACLLGNVPYPAFSQTEQPTRMMVIPNILFRQLYLQNVIWQQQVFTRMVNRMVDLMVIINEVAFQRMDQRVASWLLRQQTDAVSVTHERIAADLGTVREVVSRVLKEMESLGIIRLSRGRIDILSQRLLRDLAGSPGL